MTETTTTPGQEPNSTGQAPNPGQQTNPEPGTGGQEPRVFDEEYVKSLRGEAAKYRTERQKALDELQQLKDRDLTDQQKLQRERDELSQKLPTLEAKLARYEIAAEAGLPLNLAARLQGSTKEELAADASALKQQFGLDNGQEPTETNFDAGVRRSTGGRPKSMNGIISDLYLNRG